MTGQPYEPARHAGRALLAAMRAGPDRGSGRCLPAALVVPDGCRWPATSPANPGALLVAGLLAVLVTLLVTLLVTSPAMAMDPDPPLADPAQQAVYERLTREVRCLVCQNQTIADSTAPLAADLRREIRGLVEQGNGEEEVKDFLLARYGDFVLYRPRLRPATVALWAAPAALLVLGGFGLWRTVQRRGSLPVEADDEADPETGARPRPSGGPASGSGRGA